MASKSSQPNRYRKGKDLAEGDMVAVKWTPQAPYRPIEFSAVVSIQMVDASVAGQRGGKQYRAILENGSKTIATGSEYVEGQY